MTETCIAFGAFAEIRTIVAALSSGHEEVPVQTHRVAHEQ